MSKEYIERAVAIERARNELDLINKSHWSADEIVDFLKRLPAADVVPVRHGRWAQHYVGQERAPWGSDCSVCGEWLVIDRLVMQEKYHYCPNCGAKMDGGADK